MEPREFYELHKGKKVKHLIQGFTGIVVGYYHHWILVAQSEQQGKEWSIYEKLSPEIIPQGAYRWDCLIENLELIEDPINLVEILKGCEGMEFWCDLSGKCILERIDSDKKEYPINIVSQVGKKHHWDNLTKEGKFYNFPDGICLLWPSKTNRDWSTFKKPLKEGTSIMVKLNSQINWYLKSYQKDLNPAYKYVVPVSEFDFDDPDSNIIKSII